MKKSHKYKHGRRINPLSCSFAVIIALLWCIAPTNPTNVETYQAEHIEVATTTIEVKKPLTLEDKIRQYFPRNGETMIAVAHAESQMNVNAIGYNCYYFEGKATTTPIKGGSKSCAKKDRALSWSRDCGLLQLHVPKGECPTETVDEHLSRAAKLSKVQSLTAWSAYNNGSYKKYLTSK